LVKKPRFDAADFERERAIMLSELARGPDNPQWIAQRVLPGLLHGSENPYGVPVSGYTSTVKDLGRADVQQFYADHFDPRDATLIIVGDVDANVLIDRLEESWGKWQSAGKPTTSTVSSATADRAVYVVDKPGAVQSVLMVGRLWRGRNDPDYFATRIGNRILGGDFLSRLNQNLREEHGYTYGAQALFRYRQHGSDWLVATNVRADATGAAMQEIMSELKAPGSDRPLTESEISIARNAELNTFPAQFESPAQIASSFASLAKYHLPQDYLRGVAQELRAVDGKLASEILAKVANPDELTILIVGDQSLIEPQLRQSGFDPIKYLDADGKPVD
jgi:zinc protease